MVAAWGKVLVPVEMAVEAEAFITVLGHGLTGFFGQYLVSSPAANALKSRQTCRVRLGRDLQCFQGRTTRITREAVWMEARRYTGQRDKTTLDRVTALMAAGGGASTDGLRRRRPVGSGPRSRSGSATSAAGGGKWSS